MNRKEIDSKKVQAFDLLRKIYYSVAETKKLQQALGQLEAEIAELEKEEAKTDDVKS